MATCLYDLEFWPADAGMCMLQDEGGASRDDIAAALVEVAEGRVPKDRIALRELYREIMEWPFVEAAPEEEEDDNGASTSSPYEAITPTGVEGMLWKSTYMHRIKLPLQIQS